MHKCCGQVHFIVSNWHEFFLFFFIQNLLCNAWIGILRTPSIFIHLGCCQKSDVFWNKRRAYQPIGDWKHLSLHSPQSPQCWKVKDLEALLLRHKAFQVFFIVFWKHPSPNVGAYTLGLWPSRVQPSNYERSWGPSLPLLTIIPYYQPQIRRTQSCIVRLQLSLTFLIKKSI